MKPFYQTDRFSLYEGDCRAVLRDLSESSVDSIVCDPPYGLEFMGKNWDAPWKQGEGLGEHNAGFSEGAPAVQGVRGKIKSLPNYMGSTNPTCRNCGGTQKGRDRKSRTVCRCQQPEFPDVNIVRTRAFQEWCETWAVECLRVLKPGGHLLAFGGSRTYHRLACAIEDAGFEIRDQIQWIYGSGFPKSLNVARSIDSELCPVVGRHFWSGSALPKGGKALDGDHVCAVTAEGLAHDDQGTALKPAHEPIVLARKPLIGTVAENVLQHGTGGLNIDGCRIETKETLSGGSRRLGDGIKFGLCEPSTEYEQNTNGRWPANVITDGSDKVLAAFPDAPGQLRDQQYDSREREVQNVYGAMKRNLAEPSRDKTYEDNGGTNFAMKSGARRGDSGSAARFFYAAKASQEDRNEGCEGLPLRVSDEVHKRPRTELDDPRRAGVTPRRNNHPTVKPTDLMRYLCRLVTPPGGTVLDPFCGSGSTGKAAMLEAFKFIGIELSAEYCELAQRRIEAVTRQGLLFTAAD